MQCSTLTHVPSPKIPSVHMPECPRKHTTPSFCHELSGLETATTSANMFHPSQKQDSLVVTEPRRRRASRKRTEKLGQEILEGGRGVTRRLFSVEPLVV